jgi:hypothetical protein
MIYLSSFLSSLYTLSALINSKGLLSFQVLPLGSVFKSGYPPIGNSWHSFSFPTLPLGVFLYLIFLVTSFPNSGYLQSAKIAVGAKALPQDAKSFQVGLECV